MRRVLALVAAVAMIGGAFVLRARLNDGSDGIRGTGSARGTLVCVPELRTVCDAIGSAHPEVKVRIEEAGRTTDILGDRGFNATATPFDVWLTIAPYPDLVRIGRETDALEPVLDEPSKAIARSPLAILAFSERSEALRLRACPRGLDWACLGDAAGRPWSEVGGQPNWGTVRVGLPAPDVSATGLLSLAQGTGTALDRADYAKFDLETPRFQDWAARLAGNRTDVPALGAAITQMPASFSVIATIEAAAGPTRARLPNPGRVQVSLTQPIATADVVVVGRRGSADAAALRALVASDEVLAALVADGWRVPGRDPISSIAGGPALPDTNGLPDGGVLFALENTWKEVA